MVPIIIISFNNYKYVDNTIKQLIQINPTLEPFLIIMDNASQDPDTKEYLKNSIDSYFERTFSEMLGRDLSENIMVNITYNK